MGTFRCVKWSNFQRFYRWNNRKFLSFRSSMVVGSYSRRNVAGIVIIACGIIPVRCFEGIIWRLPLHFQLFKLLSTETGWDMDTILRASSRCRKYRTGRETIRCRWREKRRSWLRKHSIYRGFWLEDICYCRPCTLVCSFFLFIHWGKTSLRRSFFHFENITKPDLLLLIFIFADHQGKVSNLFEYAACSLRY